MNLDRYCAFVAWRSVMAHHLLDVRHTLCPIPVIRTQNRMNGLAAGDTVEVIATDPGALLDIPTWAKMNGHRLLKTYRKGLDIFVVIEVGAS